MKSRLLTVKLDTKTGVLIYETRNGMPLLKELENVKAFIPVMTQGGLLILFTKVLKPIRMKGFMDLDNFKTDR